MAKSIDSICLFAILAISLIFIVIAWLLPLVSTFLSQWVSDEIKNKHVCVYNGVQLSTLLAAASNRNHQFY